MATKRHIYLILFALSLFTTTHAQLVFSPSAWDFKQINEADGMTSHTFTATNQGDKPLVILDVITTCGCTVPAFSRQPILPGGKTEIAVTFDPANRPGVFTKELTVYSSERRKVATLTIKGTVVPRTKSNEELYPTDAGGGLRLATTLSAFTYVYPGESKQAAIGYINTSNRTIRLELRAQAKTGLLTTVYPREIAPAERGEINLTYLIPIQNSRYGTLRDVMEVVVDGDTNGILVMAHGIGVDKPDNTDPAKAPRVELSESIIKFGAIKHAAPLQRRTFTLSNTGNSELIVRAVENDGRVATTLAPGRRIAPGNNCRVELLLNPTEQEYGVMIDQLLLITNDPTRPMIRLRVTAIIED